MTSPEPFADRERVEADLASVEAALATGRVTAEDGATRALQRFALAVRAAAPEPSEAFDRALDRQLADELGESRESGFACEHGSSRRGMKIRVLVIDDFPPFREAIAAILPTDRAIEIVGTAADGAEGLRIARDTKPDVVLLDLHLPDMDATLVLEGLRRRVPDVRVLILTANEQPEHLAAAVVAGAAGFVTKAAGLAELRDAVITTHGGGTVIARSLADQLVQPAGLTPREIEVLRLGLQGLTDREIGAAIFVSRRTVQSHLARIRTKLRFESRSRFVRWLAMHVGRDDADAHCWREGRP